jgi:hypothetical protein
MDRWPLPAYHSLVDARALLLREFTLAKRAPKLEQLVPEVLVMGVEALLAARTNDPEDACHVCLL